MHIIKSYNSRVKRVYCYVGECLWDSKLKKRVNPRVSIGHLEGEPPVFVPNKRIASLLIADKKNPTATEKDDKDILDFISAKYGKNIRMISTKANKARALTAHAVFSGPSIVFGGITSRYQLDTILKKAFGEEDAMEILSLAWYLASEGDPQPISMHGSCAFLPGSCGNTMG